MWGDAAWLKRQEEQREHAERIDAANEGKAAELDRVLRESEHEPEAALVVAMARLLDATAFKLRDEGIERADRKRRGPKGNDPDHLKIIRIHERSSKLGIEFAVNQARRAIALVRAHDGTAGGPETGDADNTAESPQEGQAR